MKNEKIINIDEDLEKGINLASELFFKGGVFVYPTDTIYGFGGNPFNEEVIEKIREIKYRDESKQFILLISSIDNLLKYVNIENERKIDFLKSIWPAPVSIIFNLNERSKELFKTETAAFRIPNNRFCKKLLENINSPLISTSVNRAGGLPMKNYYLIKDEFVDEVDAIFYTCKRSYVKSSTIIKLTEQQPELLREGKITFNEILEKFKN